MQFNSLFLFVFGWFLCLLIVVSLPKSNANLAGSTKQKFRPTNRPTLAPTEENIRYELEFYVSNNTYFGHMLGNRQQSNQKCMDDIIQQRENAKYCDHELPRAFALLSYHDNRDYAVDLKSKSMEAFGKNPLRYQGNMISLSWSDFWDEPEIVMRFYNILSFPVWLGFSYDTPMLSNCNEWQDPSEFGAVSHEMDAHCSSFKYHFMCVCTTKN